MRKLNIDFQGSLKHTKGQGETKPRTTKSNLWSCKSLVLCKKGAKQGKTLWIFLLISYAVAIYATWRYTLDLNFYWFNEMRSLHLQA
jgi:hypothetical protein